MAAAADQPLDWLSFARAGVRGGGRHASRLSWVAAASCERPRRRPLTNNHTHFCRR